MLLAASGFGLARLTTAPAAVGKTPLSEKKDTQASQSGALPYRLLLSAEASEIRIASGDNPPQTTESGTLPEGTVISLSVRWKNPPAAGEQRFAKLVLEPTGKATITHVFDAAGDIDDILELP